MAGESERTENAGDDEWGRRRAFTQGEGGYLGAMKTWPSDSKLFGSSDSKSATERGKIIGEEPRAEQWGGLSGLQSVFRGAGTQEGVHHSNTEESWVGNTSVSQYGASNGT